MFRFVAKCTHLKLFFFTSVICPAGQEANDTICSDCASDHYKEDIGAADCTKCADSKVTLKMGSTLGTHCIREY